MYDYNTYTNNTNTNTNTNCDIDMNDKKNIYNYNSNSYNYLIQNKLNSIKGSWNSDYNTINKTVSKFKNSFSYHDRLNESRRVLSKYPDMIPVICEKSLGKDNPDINKNKYLVPLNLTVGNFLMVIRKRIKLLQSHEALFLLINGTIPPTSATFRDLYLTYKDSDGFMYMTYTKENVFG